MRAQEIALARPLLDYLRSRNSVRIIGPSDAETRAPTIALGLSEPGLAVAARLARHNVMASGGHFYAYRLLEAEAVSGKHIAVVGGGDSAIESALLLCEQNKVILSYRGEVFARIKPKNKERIDEAAAKGLVDVRLNTNLLEITETEITISAGNDTTPVKLMNDLVYIFAGGELPTQFLNKIGLQITTKFGEAVLKH